MADRQGCTKDGIHVPENPNYKMISARITKPITWKGEQKDFSSRIEDLFHPSTTFRRCDELFTSCYDNMASLPQVSWENINMYQWIQSTQPQLD